MYCLYTLIALLFSLSAWYILRLRPGALFLLDIDKFKSVNDTLGHQGGDQALICVANALRQALGGRGFVGTAAGISI